MAAKKIIELINKKNNACIAFSAWDLPCDFFDELVNRYISGDVDFSKAKVFSVCEFVSGSNLGEMLSERFINRVNVSVDNCYILNNDNFSRYDEVIASFGGLDMTVLGIGENCRIGFNEPGTAFSSLTHIQKLSDTVRKQFITQFDTFEAVPKKGMTLGIKTIINSKEIIIPVFGKELSDALFRTLYARNDASTPSAFLQISSDVSVYADPEAAARL